MFSVLMVMCGPGAGVSGALSSGLLAFRLEFGGLGCSALGVYL